VHLEVHSSRGSFLSKTSPRSSSSSVRNCTTTPHAGSIWTAFYWCYHQDSPLLAGILGSPLGICASLFCGELLPSSYQCPHMRPACVSSLIFMGMWWETDSWLRVLSALGARYSSVAELATRYSVFHTYSPPFLGMNIYIIFENTSRTSLDHKWGGLLPLLVMKTWGVQKELQNVPLTLMKKKILIFMTKC